MGATHFCRLRHFIFIGRHVSLGSCGGLSTNQQKCSGAEAFNHRRLRLRSKPRIQRLFIYLYRSPSFRRQLPLAPTVYSLLGDAHPVNEANGRKVALSSIRGGIPCLLQEGESRDSVVSEKEVMRIKNNPRSNRRLNNGKKKYLMNRLFA